LKKWWTVGIAASLLWWGTIGCGATPSAPAKETESKSAVPAKPTPAPTPAPAPEVSEPEATRQEKAAYLEQVGTLSDRMAEGMRAVAQGLSLIQNGDTESGFGLLDEGVTRYESALRELKQLHTPGMADFQQFHADLLEADEGILHAVKQLRIGITTGNREMIQSATNALDRWNTRLDELARQMQILG